MHTLKGKIEFEHRSTLPEKKDYEIANVNKWGIK